jgi:hypothetical protein
MGYKEDLEISTNYDFYSNLHPIIINEELISKTLEFSRYYEESNGSILHKVGSGQELKSSLKLSHHSDKRVVK